jgi:hypothetical protein
MDTVSSPALAGVTNGDDSTGFTGKWNRWALEPTPTAH